MTAVLLDTHVWAWTLRERGRLTTKASKAIEDADEVYLSSVTFYEIGQKVRIGKWPDMVPFLDRLLDIVEQQGITIAKIDGRICLSAGLMEWEHRDPFDRLLAATALALRIPIVSADHVFDGIVLRLW